MYNPGEIKGFCPESCYLRPSLTFLLTSAIPEPDLPHDTVPEPRAQMVRLFWSSPLFARKMLQKSPKYQGQRAM